MNSQVQVFPDRNKIQFRRAVGRPRGPGRWQLPNPAAAASVEEVVVQCFLNLPSPLYSAMDPRPQNPTGPATRSTVYDQPADDSASSLPPASSPDPASAAPGPTTEPASVPAAPAAADGEETLTDPATPVQPDTSGETDPGASAANDAHPL